MKGCLKIVVFLFVVGALLFQFPTFASANEIWVPADRFPVYTGNWATTRYGDARFSFGVPDDYKSFTKARVVVMATKTVSLNYEAVLTTGESGTPISNPVNTITGSYGKITKGLMYEVDISNLFTGINLNAGTDTLNVFFVTPPTNGTTQLSMRILGFKFDYVTSNDGTGPQGPIGATGPQGLVGDTGSVGATGPKGDPGSQGQMGLPGAIGPQGPVGATGPQGPAGTAGKSSSLNVYSEDNQFIGYLTSPPMQDSTIGVFIPDLNLFTTLVLPCGKTTYSIITEQVYFAGSGCSGTPYIKVFETYQLFQAAPGIYYTGGKLHTEYSTSNPFKYTSTINTTSGACTNSTGVLVDNVYEAKTSNGPQFKVPILTPLEFQLN